MLNWPRMTCSSKPSILALCSKRKPVTRATTPVLSLPMTVIVANCFIFPEPWGDLFSKHLAEFRAGEEVEHGLFDFGHPVFQLALENFAVAERLANGARYFIHVRAAQLNDGGAAADGVQYTGEFAAISAADGGDPWRGRGAAGGHRGAEKKIACAHDEMCPG